MKNIADSVKLGQNVILQDFINLYGCEIDDDSRIGPFVEIQKNAFIGKRCKIQSHTFICEGVTIEDDAFVGHGVMFINDKYPLSINEDGGLQTEDDWQVGWGGETVVLDDNGRFPTDSAPDFDDFDTAIEF